MRRYIAYLKYVVQHKWYVMMECFELGLYWQGLVHDLSKFLPSEFIPYAKHFNNKDGTKKEVRTKGYYKPTDTGDAAFDFAWLLHQKRNKHHWQWWVLPEDGGGVKVLKMPRKYIAEMVCDWVGAGKAQGFVSPKNKKYFETRNWYMDNQYKMQLHPETRSIVEIMIHFNNIM